MCPVECCVPNPSVRETEAQLLQRAIELHPDQTFPSVDTLDAGTSRFKNAKWINANR